MCRTKGVNFLMARVTRSCGTVSVSKHASVSYQSITPTHPVIPWLFTRPPSASLRSIEFSGLSMQCVTAASPPLSSQCCGDAAFSAIYASSYSSSSQSTCEYVCSIGDQKLRKIRSEGESEWLGIILTSASVET